MKRRIAVTVLLAFATTSASAGHSHGHSAGGHAGGGGHSAGGHSGGAHVSGARSSWAHVATHRSAGSGDHAVPRGTVVSRSGASDRHPRVGYGIGSFYRGDGYGRYGYGSYSHGRYGYGRGYSGRYPNFGYRSSYFPYRSSYYRYRSFRYPYYGFGGWPYLGLGFYYGGGPYYVGGYPTLWPYYATGGGYVSDEPYPADTDDMDAPYAPDAAPSAGAAADAGELRLEVFPDDAVVYIDDDFRGTARQLRRVTVAPGVHRIEAVRPGFRVANREVQVGARAAVAVRIDLERP